MQSTEFQSSHNKAKLNRKEKNMIKTEFIVLAQSKSNQRRAEEYSAQVQKFRKQKRIRKAVTGILVAAFFILGFAIVGKQDVETLQAKEITTENEQKYIVRYGILEKNLIVTKDGNTWSLTDEPEYENGTEVRVLFDSRETKDAKDDAIIDITERR